MLEPGSLRQAAGPFAIAADSDVLNVELLRRGLVADGGLRVFPIEIDGKRYWVKRTRKNLPNPVGKLLHRLTQWVAGKDPDALASHEVACLNKLRRSGFLTPEVVMEFVGKLTSVDEMTLLASFAKWLRRHAKEYRNP